jgi:RNA polymerase primary sigma factor
MLMEKSLEIPEFDAQRTPVNHEHIFWTGGDNQDEDGIEAGIGEENKNDLADSDYEPLKMYFKEMANISLLTREGEIETAKSIEKGRAKLVEIIFSIPAAAQKLLMLGEAIRSGEAGLDCVIQNNSDSDGAYETKKFLAAIDRIKKLYQKSRQSQGKVPKRVKNS